MTDGGTTRARDRWNTLRRTKSFLPVAILAPALAITGAGFGGYAIWDSTRVDVPNVIGQSLPSGSDALLSLQLHVDPPTLPDETLDPGCYVIAGQSVAAGSRVVADDTRLTLDIEPGRRIVPDVVGDSLSAAKVDLLTACLHEDVLSTWCLPQGFSGWDVPIARDLLFEDSGFRFDSDAELLENDSLTPDESWSVCRQTDHAASWSSAESSVGLMLTVPLTTVPAAAESTLGPQLKALGRTADGCSLDSRIEPTFESDPAAITGARLPPESQVSGWTVVSMSPSAGHAILCDEVVRISVAWPSTTMPQLIGLHHVPASAGEATAATAALEASSLPATCSGKGTVTRQVPAAGTSVPIGVATTCVAELVVPNLVGLDPPSADAALVASGLSGSGSGAGFVVSQTPQAGTVLASPQPVTYRAAIPQPVPFAGGGGAFYENCTAARAAGAAPLYRGDPGYRSALDRDDDGIACE